MLMISSDDLLSFRIPWTSQTTTTTRWRWPILQLRFSLPRRWLVNLASATALPSALWTWNRYSSVSLHKFSIPLCGFSSDVTLLAAFLFSDWLYGSHYPCRRDELHVVSIASWCVSVFTDGMRHCHLLEVFVNLVICANVNFGKWFQR